MQENGIKFGKIHDLEILLKDILPINPNWSFLRDSLIILTTYAVDYRYPGVATTKDEADEALTHCNAVRKTIRQFFNL
jgi:hypothetical protein